MANIRLCSDSSHGIASRAFAHHAQDSHVELVYWIVFLGIATLISACSLRSS